jgi:hypothetical protein
LESERVTREKLIEAINKSRIENFEAFNISKKSDHKILTLSLHFDIQRGNVEVVKLLLSKFPS